MNQNQRKLLVSDYDRTFYINEKDITKNIELVDQFRKKGNIFVIATGRSALDFQQVKDQYQLQYDYVLINHGATMMDQDGNILKNTVIDPVLLPKLVSLLDLEHSLASFCCSGYESRVTFEHGNITKINVLYDSTSKAIEIATKIRTHFSGLLRVYKTTSNSVEIVSYKAGKKNAITWLFLLKQLEKYSVVTVGDGETDVEMIQEWNGYRMEQSVDILKQNVTRTVSSVSEVLEKII